MAQMPGLHRKTFTFRNRKLDGYSVSVVELVGAAGPGPHVAVMAGMHPNEVSSIQATFQLESSVDLAQLRGRLSIINVLNRTAWAGRDVLMCPVDGRNINFCFPGNPDGSFSEMLADAVLTDWAADADCLIDLHGGDLCEEVMPFTVCQMTGVASFDERALELACLFDVEAVVCLSSDSLTERGRSVTGRATELRDGAFVEAGVGGVVDEASVAVHHDGILRVAQRYGMLPEGYASRLTSTPKRVTQYAWVSAPRTGWCDMRVRAGDEVARGQELATVRDLDSGEVTTIRADVSGIVLWHDTSPVVAENRTVAGIGHN